MSRAFRQRGVALFTVVFLIVVVGALAISVGLISGQQQLSSAQSLDQTRAYYSARARLDREIADMLGGGSCSTPDTITGDIGGFTTVVDQCSRTPVDEGGAGYDVIELEVRAFRGNAESGTLVQRSIGAQVTDAP